MGAAIAPPTSLIQEDAEPTEGILSLLYPPATKLGGGVYWNHLVRPSVRL